MSDRKKREFRDYINDIIEATHNIQEFVRDLDYDHFFHDKKTTYACMSSNDSDTRLSDGFASPCYS